MSNDKSQPNETLEIQEYVNLQENLAGPDWSLLNWTEDDSRKEESEVLESTYGTKAEWVEDKTNCSKSYSPERKEPIDTAIKQQAAKKKTEPSTGK